MKVAICIGSACHLKGSRDVIKKLQELVAGPVDLTVGPAEEQDAIVTVWHVLDDRVTGGAVYAAHQRGIHTGCAQLFQQEVPVRTDGSGHGGIEPRTGQGDGLVEPLSSAEAAEHRCGQGLAPCNKMRDLIDIVDVQRAKAQCSHPIASRSG